jgi:hypothetical protein
MELIYLNIHRKRHRQNCANDSKKLQHINYQYHQDN